MPCTPWRKTSSAMRKLSRNRRPWQPPAASLGNHDHGVHAFEQLLQAALGLLLAALPSKLNGQVMTATVRCPSRWPRSNDGGGAVPVPPPDRGDEDHVAFQAALSGFQSAYDLRPVSAPPAGGGTGPQLGLTGAGDSLKRLHVGVAAINSTPAIEPESWIDGIAAAAAHADNLDAGSRTPLRDTDAQLPVRYSTHSTL